MNVVIVGDGKVGSTLTAQLVKEGHDVTIIDNRMSALDESMNSLDVIGIEGNGASYTVQLEAGVDKADLLIAATSMDEVNMLCCLVAKKLGAKHTIARVRNPEYHQQMIFMGNELGLSMAVNPEQAAANEISRILRFPSAIKVDPFAKGKVELVEFRLREGSPLNGMTLSELGKKYQQTKVLICAVERGDEVFIPTGDFVLHDGDKVSLTAAPRETAAFFKAVGMFKKSVRNVIIVGGGRIAFYLARELTELGIDVKIIEKKEARALELSELLPKASIILGDGTDQEVLHEEGLDSTDAFVALTGFDEENIIISMYANVCKVDKVITKVNKTSFVDMLGASGLESFVSPKETTSHRILSYVRAMQNSLGSNVETLYRIVDGRVEALEFRVREGARCLGVKLMNLQLRKNVLIAGIIRAGKCIIPGGNDIICEGDSVIVVTTNQGLDDLDDILS